jgi:hypothetical protein
MLRRELLIVPLLLAMGCTKVYNQPASPSNPVSPDPVVVSHLVEFRVTGTINTATITASDSQEGMELISTGLPWFKSFKITQDTFLYLDASSFDTGVLHVQIYVDGSIFREAFANGFEPKIAVSGQFHVVEIK